MGGVLGGVFHLVVLDGVLSHTQVHNMHMVAMILTSSFSFLIPTDQQIARLDCIIELGCFCSMSCMWLGILYRYKQLSCQILDLHVLLEVHAWIYMYIICHFE